MKPNLLRVVGALCLFVATGCPGEPVTPAAELVIRGVTVLSPEDGSVSPDRAVLVADGRIVAIVPTSEMRSSDDTRVIEADGYFLIPGMWDLHTHLSFADRNAGPLMITQGVTGARDMGAVLEEIEEIRAEFERGETLGPRIVRAGPTLNGAVYGRHQRLIDSPAAARAAVLELDSVGVDILKTHNATGRETYFALLRAAAEAGLTVVGHVPTDVSPLEACEGGQSSIDHIATIFEGRYLDRFESQMEAFQSMDAWLENEAPALAACLASHATLFVPTLYTYHFRAHRASYYDTPPTGWEYLTRESRETFRTENLPSEADRDPEVTALRESLVEIGQAFTRMLYEAGAPIGAGTDFAAPGVVPGFGLHREIELLVEAGLPAHVAVRAATRGPGAMASLDPLRGRIEVGSPADLVLLRANPFDDIDALTAIEGVGLRGRWLDRTELDGILGSLAAN